jgi:hypothetical protein
MKTAILATALATAAALPKMDKIVDREVKAVYKEAHENRMDKKEVVKRAVAERVIEEKDIDKNGLLTPQSHSYSMYFEVNAGENGCDSTNRQETFGIATNQCWDGVWQVEDKPGDYGYPVSHMIFMPNNGGFPFFAAFDGHGCNWENAFWFGRTPKRDFFGFPGTYSPWHGCYAFQDDLGNNVYHMEASWSTGLNPTYDAAVFTGARSNKACYRGKVGYYEVMRSNSCIAWEEDGTMTSEKIVVNSCDEATQTIDVDVFHYSDGNCVNLVGSEKHTSPEECVFDGEHFKDEIMYEGGVDFEYENKTCFKV